MRYAPALKAPDKFPVKKAPSRGAAPGWVARQIRAIEMAVRGEVPKPLEKGNPEVEEPVEVIAVLTAGATGQRWEWLLKDWLCSIPPAQFGL